AKFMLMMKPWWGRILAAQSIDQGRLTGAAPIARTQGGVLRRVGKTGLLLCAAAALALAAGFTWFICRVPAQEVRLSRDADGIVALTGGASRITDAIELLASGRGQRL